MVHGDQEAKPRFSTQDGKCWRKIENRIMAMGIFKFQIKNENGDLITPRVKIFPKWCSPLFRTRVLPIVVLENEVLHTRTCNLCPEWHSALGHPDIQPSKDCYGALRTLANCNANIQNSGCPDGLRWSRKVKKSPLRSGTSLTIFVMTKMYLKYWKYFLQTDSHSLVFELTGYYSIPLRFGFDLATLLDCNIYTVWERFFVVERARLEPRTSLIETSDPTNWANRS